MWRIVPHWPSLHLKATGIRLRDILTQHALENAMLVHAAVGGSMNLLLHVPAIAPAAHLSLPTVADWQAVNRSVPRLVDALPNGPRNHPTVQVFFAGAVPEVMLHLRAMGLLHLDVLTVSGQTLGENLDWWAQSARRRLCRERLAAEAGVDPDHVIMGPEQARANGLGSTVVFPVGNIAPQGSVVKATAIDPGVISPDNVYRKRGTVRIFTSEKDAVAAVKGTTDTPVEPGNVIVLIGIGPLGTGMEETYQLTSALKYIPWGKHVPVITDGVSAASRLGLHRTRGTRSVGWRPNGKLRDGDVITS
jgi:dihydroxyacid dehydratase/phosphogluconate dehydratase